LSVAIVEREAFPRERPGETLHPGLEPLLTQLGVAERLRLESRGRHRGIVSDGTFVPYGSDADGEWRGYQIARRDLDAALLDEAANRGCVLMQPNKAVDVLDDDRICGARLACGARLRSRWILDACGGGHWLARRLGLRIRELSPPLIARYGYVRGECAALNDAPQFTRRDRTWTWMAQVEQHRYHWARVDPASVDGARPTLLDHLEADGPTRAADVTWRRVAPAAGEGFFLAGDAALVLDPSGGTGVLRGLMTGIMAAHAMTRVSRGELTDQAATEGYDAWLGDWTTEITTRLRQSVHYEPSIQSAE